MFMPLISPGLLEGVESGSWDCLPSNFSVTEVWSDGGATYDLNSIVTDQGGANQIISFDMNASGTKVILSTAATAKIYVYTLSTPFDFSTGTLSSSRSYTAGGNCVAFYGGTGYVVLNNAGTTDTFERYAGAYAVSDSDTKHSDLVDTEVGSASSQDGFATFNRGKSAVYWWTEVVSAQTYLTRTPTSSGDLDSPGTTVQVDFDPPFGTANEYSGTAVSPDEATVYAMIGSKLYLGTMTSKGDITTLTWNTTNVLDMTSSTYSGPGSIWVSQDGQTIYTNGATYDSPKIMKLVCGA